MRISTFQIPFSRKDSKTSCHERAVIEIFPDDTRKTPPIGHFGLTFFSSKYSFSTFQMTLSLKEINLLIRHKILACGRGGQGNRRGVEWWLGGPRIESHLGQKTFQEATSVGLAMLADLNWTSS